MPGRPAVARRLRLRAGAVAQLLGAVLDLTGRGLLAALAVNLAGAAAVVAIAYFVAWIKGAPWGSPSRRDAGARAVHVVAPPVATSPPPQRDKVRRRA